MPALTTQTHLRSVRDLPFCHACGRPFLPGDRTDRDHIPPQACFDKPDRNPPLKLRSHVACNNAHKLNDEKVGELLAIQRAASVERARSLQVRLLTESSTRHLLGATTNLDLIGCIRRWVTGFHAALYREPLNPFAHFQITPPLAHAPLGPRVSVVPIPGHVPAFVQTLKLNRLARNVDRIVTNGGKLRYECVWAQEDTSENWLCIFGLDLYRWAGLGDWRFGPRGCTGAYRLDHGGLPERATRATRLEAPIPNRDPFDAFGL
jgi:hypothetical protein